MIGRSEKWLRISGFVLISLVIGFGAVTLVRSAFQSVRKTDLTVYLRAAWAVRSGEDLYQVADEHDWHYHYPPLLASVLVPFAQPPADVEEKALVPFPTVVVLWYALGVACFFASVSLLAPAVGTPAVHRTGRYRRWLVHVPIWVLLPALGSSLGRGQVNEIVLVLLVGMIVCAIRGNRFAAGALMAGAACIKVIPMFLLVYPLWKRDWKWLGGSAAGLLVGLFLVPACIVGPTRTAQLYRDWFNQFLRPAVAADTASPRGGELLGMIATDNQSIQGVIHNTRHLDRATRPDVADPSTRILHWLIGGVLTIVTLASAKNSDIKEPHREALALGALIVVMILVSPVCHLHYFVLLLPLIIALTASHLANGGRVRPALCGILILNFFTALLPRLPGLEYARDIGLASLGAMALWIAAVIELAGESRLKVKLPGYRKAQALWSRRRTVTIHEAGSNTRRIPDNIRRSMG